MSSVEDQMANLQANQQALINENNQLRQAMQNAQNSVGLIYSKMLAVKKDIGSIGKDQKNSFQGFKFRGIDQFVNALHPILNKHGVGITTKVLQNSEEYKTNDKGKISKNVRLVIEYTFFAEDGSTIVCAMPAEGIDTSDKATNKALSAAFKYCLIQTLCVPTEDMAEADGDSTQINSEELKSTTTKATKATKSTPNNSSTSFRKKKAAGNAAVALVEDEDDL